MGADLIRDAGDGLRFTTHFSPQSKMKRTALLLSLLVSSLLLGGGCAPRLSRYEHVVVQPSARLAILTRSSDSTDTQGKPLRGAKIGLPITSSLSSPSYAVGIHAPLQHQPLIFLRAEDAAKKPLQLRGANIRELEAHAGLRVTEGYTHAFDVTGSGRGQIDLEVVSGDGQVLGREMIGYDVVTRGYRWGVDTL